MEKNAQSGNVLVYILIAIFLIGSLTVALRNSGDMDGGIDRESANVKAQQIIRYSAELAQGVKIVMDNGASETEMRFAHPHADAAYGTITNTPQFQVFSNEGGKARYRFPDPQVTTDDKWDFSANRAMPLVGSDKAEITATIAPIDDLVCKAINQQLGIATIPSTDCGSGIAAFAGAFPAPFTFNTADFPATPLPQFCVHCTASNRNMYITTVLAR